jgi:hypothetical protein
VHVFVFSTHTWAVKEMYMYQHIIGQTSWEQYLVLLFDIHARKYTSKLLDLVSHRILMMESPTYRVKEISHMNMVF